MTDTMTSNQSLRERALAAYRAAVAEQEARRAAELAEHHRLTIAHFVEEVERVLGHGVEIGEAVVSQDADGRHQAMATVDGEVMQVKWSTHGLVARFRCAHCGQPDVWSDHFTTLTGYGAALDGYATGDERQRTCWSCLTRRPNPAPVIQSDEVPF